MTATDNKYNSSNSNTAILSACELLKMCGLLCERGKEWMEKKKEKRITKPMSIGQLWTDVIKIAIIIYEMIAFLWWSYIHMHKIHVCEDPVYRWPF